MRKLVFCGLVIFAAACSPLDDRTHLVGDVVDKRPSPDGSAVGILTREGSLYRVYIQGNLPGEALQKMFETNQKVSSPKLVWSSSVTLLLEKLCGYVELRYTHTNDYLYPHKGKTGGIGVGVRLNCG